MHKCCEKQKLRPDPMMASQELYLDEGLFDAAVNGDKKGTTRKGRRDLRPGPLLLRSNELDRRTVVDVRYVLYMYFGDLPQSVIRSEGCESLDELAQVLRKFYPDLCEDDVCTAVEWS